MNDCGSVQKAEDLKLGQLMQDTEEDLNFAQQRLGTISQCIIGEQTLTDWEEKRVSEESIDSVMEKTKRIREKVKNIIKMLSLIESKI